MEKLNINSLLSWKDIIALGDPNGAGQTTLSVLMLEDCCRSKYDKNRFNELYKEYVIKPFRKDVKTIDSVPDKLLNLRPVYAKDENGNWRLTYSKPDFFSAMIALSTPAFPTGEVGVEKLKEIQDEFESYETEDELKEAVVGYLRDNKKKYIQLIRDSSELSGISVSITPFGYSPALADRLLMETLIQCRDVINYYIKNIDYVMEYLSKDFPMEVFEPVDKDRALLVLSRMCEKEEKIEEMFENVPINVDKVKEGLEDQSIVTYLNYVNNYRLILDYIEQENKGTYENNTTISLVREGNIIINTEGTLIWFNKLLEVIKKNPELKEKLNFYESYEDLLRDKASETWKQIENKKLVESIKVNFEMIKSGPKIDLGNYSGRKIVRITSNKEKRQAKLKRDYDILDEKLAFYEEHKGVAHGVGINNFTGYFAEFYPNGSVVLDKLFKYQIPKRGENKGKEIMVPAADEAIYVMNYKEFADLSKYTKMELIQEITDFDNQDVKRIYHSRNWKDKVLSEINGDGYGGLDLSLLNMLTESITAKQKSL